MPIEKTPCAMCAANLAVGDPAHYPYMNHAPISPHCQYCGQGYKNGEGAGGLWYQQVYYAGHTACMIAVGGPALELFLMKLAAGQITQAEHNTHAPQA